MSKSKVIKASDKDSSTIGMSNPPKEGQVIKNGKVVNGATKIVEAKAEKVEVK